MKRIDSVISLVLSLTKAEKKLLSLRRGGERRDYLVVYDIIGRLSEPTPEKVKEQFRRECPKGAFDGAVHYLYGFLTDALMQLRAGKDLYYELLHNIGKARMMFERSMFQECFEFIEKTKVLAARHEINEILVLAGKLELECLFQLDFLDVSEKDLFHRHFVLEDAQRKLMRIAEQSQLHNLMLHRMSRKGAIRSDRQRQGINDLMVNEFSIKSQFVDEGDIFEMRRNNKLFHANYFTSVGDYAAALAAYRQLLELFEAKRQLWANPPVYYLAVLGGVLQCLRMSGQYEAMKPYTQRLAELAEGEWSAEFKANCHCMLFLNELFPHLDFGDFECCAALFDAYGAKHIDKDMRLSPAMRCELAVYKALMYIGRQNYKMARTEIARVIIDHNVKYLPLIHTLRLVRLICYYEMDDIEAFRHECRSIQRGVLTTDGRKSYRTERLLIKFVSKTNRPLFEKDREAYWQMLLPEIEEIRADRFERKLLDVFDFTAWVEAKVLKTSLGAVMKKRNIRCDN